MALETAQKETGHEHVVPSLKGNDILSGFETLFNLYKMSCWEVWDSNFSNAIVDRIIAILLDCTEFPFTQQLSRKIFSRLCYAPFAKLIPEVWTVERAQYGNRDWERWPAGMWDEMNRYWTQT